MSKSFHKFLAAGTTAALVASAVAPSASAFGAHPFTDVSSNYDEAVSFLYTFEIIKGKTKDTFGTNLELTRGDAAVILANALGLDTENAPDAGFTDLIPRIEGSVNALADAGIISGTSKTTFSPNQLLTRGAMSKILVLGFELEGYAVETPFVDAVGAFEPYVEALYGTGITNGKTPTSYGTGLKITRGEFANLLYRTIEFAYEDMYIPYAASVENVDSTSFKIVLEEAAPAEYTAQDIGDMFYVEVILDSGESVYVEPTAYILSSDRTTLTVQHRNYDLAGKAGTIIVDGEVEVNFDYKTTASAGHLTLTSAFNSTDYGFSALEAAPAVKGVSPVKGIQVTASV
jgi:hypothetical protein